MSQYIKIRTKRLSVLFIIPLLVEMVIFLYAKFSNNSDSILEYHGLWYLAASVILCFVSTYQLIQNYYIGHDMLWKILPYSKGILAFIDIIFYIFGTIIFGMVYQAIQAMISKQTFYSNVYIPEKLLSLFSFYLLIMAMCVLFKNVQNPLIGRSLILGLSLVIIITQISTFWNLNHTIIKSFMSGISNAGSIKNLVYINILPYIFFEVNKTQLTMLSYSSFILNSLICVFSIILILISFKFRRLNYIDLVG